MPALETAQEAGVRNRNGAMFVVIGVCLILASVSDDAAKAATWAALFTPHEVFGLLGHAAGAVLLYLGAKRQDP